MNDDHLLRTLASVGGRLADQRLSEPLPAPLTAPALALGRASGAGPGELRAEAGAALGAGLVLGSADELAPRGTLLAAALPQAPAAAPAGLRGLHARADGWYEHDSAGASRRLSRPFVSFGAAPARVYSLASLTAGAYTVSAASYGVESAASAVAVWAQGIFSVAHNMNQALFRQTGGGPNSYVLSMRGLVANLRSECAGLVPLNAQGRFELVITLDGGGTLTAFILAIAGYWL